MVHHRCNDGALLMVRNVRAAAKDWALPKPHKAQLISDLWCGAGKEFMVPFTKTHKMMKVSVSCELWILSRVLGSKRRSDWLQETHTECMPSEVHIKSILFDLRVN